MKFFYRMFHKTKRLFFSYDFYFFLASEIIDKIRKMLNI